LERAEQTTGEDTMHEKRWPQEQIATWYEKQPWLVGCNFIPSTAVNQLEMWQEETFDAETIERELRWAAGLGFNTVRVYLHDLAWEADRVGFRTRVDRYLAIADSYAISTLFVLFDDCWNDGPRAGPQTEPVPGVHNSGWLQSPGSRLVADPTAWARLERYVTDVLGAFARDERVLLWDLYNEPGNNGLGVKSLPLLRKAFEWARAAAPTQPLTAALWFDNKELNEFQLGASDVVTFHNYLDAESVSRQIEALKVHGRPVMCTEYMARTMGSRFETHLPVFKEEGVGCYNWGLVSGKTQTIYQWGSAEGTPEPDVWFHDILRQDGTPFDSQEVQLIKSLTREKH
jgi:hypothetical protein